MSTPTPFATVTPPRSPLAREVASFGAVHLEVTDLGRSAAFWRDVVGLHLRASTREMVELGTGDDTLVTLHAGAKAPFQKGYSGLYHLAIHPPTEPDFARILLRLARAGWPISPTDHVMSKALYLVDPDGITVEITLETPQRMREFVVTDRSLYVVHADGSISSGRDPLDVNAVLATLSDDDTSVPVPDDTKIGHVHLYVGDLNAAHSFYLSLGFNPATYAPSFGMADLGAGGAFNHRIAVNTWQGQGAPQSPAGTARMRGFTIRMDTSDRLHEVLDTLDESTETDGGFLTRDPAGNRILLTHPAPETKRFHSSMAAQL